MILFREKTSGPEFRRLATGDATVVVVADGYRTFPLSNTLVVNADRAAVNIALEEAGMPVDEMTIHFNPVVVETGGRRLLIDTGNGPAARAEANSTRGWLPQSMEKAGIAPADIDTVVISHFHGDHINGLLDEKGKPAFPNAEILVPKPEWDFWMGAAVPEKLAGIATAARKIFAPLEGRIRPYAWDEEIAPGLTAVATPGHTPGHTSFLLTSGGEAVFIQSDVTNHPALFVRNPGWHAAFDIDAVAAEAVRRETYDRLAKDGIPVQGFHYPFPGRSRIKKDGKRYKLTPA